MGAAANPPAAQSQEREMEAEADAFVPRPLPFAEARGAATAGKEPHLGRPFRLAGGSGEEEELPRGSARSLRPCLLPLLRDGPRGAWRGKRAATGAA